jgi:hypothetical protein
MACVTGDGQTRPSLTSHLRDIRQTGHEVMSILVSQEADVLLANLANGHDMSIHSPLTNTYETSNTDVRP